MSDKCVSCGFTGPDSSYHGLPRDSDRKAKWVTLLQLDAQRLKPHSRVCSRHFNDAQFQTKSRFRLKNTALPMPAGQLYTANQKDKSVALPSSSNQHLSACSDSILSAGINKWSGMASQNYFLNLNVVLKTTPSGSAAKKSEMDTDMRNQAIPTRYQCSCGKKFIEKFRLHRHERIHRELQQRKSARKKRKECRDYVSTRSDKLKERKSRHHKQYASKTTSSALSKKHQRRLISNELRVLNLTAKLKEAQRELSQVNKLVSPPTHPRTPKEMLVYLFGEDPRLLKFFTHQHRRSKKPRSAGIEYSEEEREEAFTMWCIAGQLTYKYALREAGLHLPGKRMLDAWSKTLGNEKETEDITGTHSSDIAEAAKENTVAVAADDSDSSSDGEFDENSSIVELNPYVRGLAKMRRPYCRVCGKRFYQLEKLARHQLMHSQKRIFKCEACDYSSTRSDALKEHRKYCHPGEGASANGPLDSVGGKETSSETQKAYESKFSSDGSGQVCSSFQLDSGASRVEEARPHPCTICGKRFRQKNNLTQHKKVHDRPFKCEECDYTAAHKIYLDKHKNRHRGPNPSSITTCRSQSQHHPDSLASIGSNSEGTEEGSSSHIGNEPDGSDKHCSPVQSDPRLSSPLESESHPCSFCGK